MRTKLATLVAKEEGFGRPGVIPTIRHNPGDLRHGPHCEHPGGPAHANDVGTIDTDQHGWDDLERQLRIFAQMGLTIRQSLNVYLGVPRDAPADIADVDGNNRVRYIHDVCAGMGMSPDTLISVALTVPS